MSRLKRMLVPSFWKIPKKATKWVATPRPGPHKKFESIPLQIVLRDILKVAETGKEVRTIVKAGEVIVDGRKRKDAHYSVGLMDAIAIPKINKFYRVVPTARGLELTEIEEKEANVKLCRINGKTVLKKERMQLNLHDGKNIFVKDGYATGDSLLVETNPLKVVEHLKMEKGNLGLIIKGKNAGKVGVIKEIIAGKMREPSKVVCDIEGKDFTIVKDHVFVVGKNNPAIKLS